MRQLVLDYYIVLRSVLRDKPQVGRLLTRCRHCGIFFIADRRNVGRRDLGCPFGCSDLHRRRRSTERSIHYNGSAKGKLKRYKRQEERRVAEERSASEVSQAAEVHPATVEAAQDPVVELLPRRVVHPCPSPEVSQSETDQTTSSAETVACGPVSSSSADCGGPSFRDRGSSAIADSALAESDRLEIDPGIVTYVGFVISLLEGRSVHREEILEMLARRRKQHSFAREKRIDYVLRRLRKEPETPP